MIQKKLLLTTYKIHYFIFFLECQGIVCIYLYFFIHDFLTRNSLLSIPHRDQPASDALPSSGGR